MKKSNLDTIVLFENKRQLKKQYFFLKKFTEGDIFYSLLTRYKVFHKVPQILNIYPLKENIQTGSVIQEDEIAE